jgi:SAM-dependent methyltransferase
LAGVLRGEVDPLSLLLPGGSSELLEQMYSGTAAARAFNEVMQDAVRRVLADLPPNRRLSVLEIGAGTGGATSALLPILPAEQSDYLFTDVSPLFLTRAAERFAAYRFLRFGLLDIEQSPDEQGYGDEKFDIIVAANVLHATADLRRTLGHVRALLKPGGLLLLLEVTQSQMWVDLTFGLTDGWWRFQDSDLRPDYPLLPAEGWLRLLEEMGFEGPIAAGGSAAEREGAAQSIIMAREPLKPATQAAGEWLIFADEGGVGERLESALAAGGGRPSIGGRMTLSGCWAMWGRRATCGEWSTCGGSMRLSRTTCWRQPP